MSAFTNNTSPDVAKRIEKQVTNESLKEQKQVKHALRELGHLEKQDHKAGKKTEKGEKALNKAERKEESTLRAMNKHIQRHDDAVVNVHGRTRDLDTLRAQEEKLHKALKDKRIAVEEIVKHKDEHEKERLARLEEARGGSANPPKPEGNNVLDSSEVHTEPRELQ